jgi:hypothetical protein
MTDRLLSLESRACLAGHARVPESPRFPPSGLVAQCKIEALPVNRPPSPKPPANRQTIVYEERKITHVPRPPLYDNGNDYGSGHLVISHSNIDMRLKSAT